MLGPIGLKPSSTISTLSVAEKQMSHFLRPKETAQLAMPNQPGAKDRLVKKFPNCSLES